MYQVKLADFEGPLDLLIHLIEKDKIDIYDIPIVSVTEQYVAYLNAMQEYNLDVASEFLLMAAMLLQIKSRMLLPKPPAEEGEEEADRKNHSEVIATFLAVLELLRLKEIELIQEEPFGPMVLEPRKEATHETHQDR